MYLLDVIIQFEMNESIEFYSKFDQGFSGIVHLLSNLAPSAILRDYFFGLFISMFYANLISNFFNNLNQVIASELKVDINQISDIKKKFGHVEKQMKLYISNPSNNVKIDKTYYESFKEDLRINFPAILSVLLEIEKQVRFDDVDEYLIKKKVELENTGNSSADYKTLIKTKTLELYIQKNRNVMLKDLNLDITVRSPELVMDTIRQLNESYYPTEKERLLAKIQKTRRDLTAFTERLYERWKKPLELFEMMIQYSIELGEKQKKRLGGKNTVITNPKHVALIKIHSRSILIAREILVLLKAGYIDGAQARWRSMHELAVISLFLLEQETNVSERYLDHRYIRQAFESKDFNDYSNKTGYSPYTNEEIQIFEDTRKNLVKKYGDDYIYQNGFGWIPTRITKNRNFRELEKLSGIDHLRPYYNWSTNQVHGGAHGFNFLGVPKVDQEKLLFIGPSNYGVTDPIHSAALSLMHTTMALLSSIKYPEVVKELDILGRFSNEVGDRAIEITREFEQE